ncbi:NAD(P)H-dependent oxidoreductase [Cytobacillus sp. FJAT-54145]|uniref:NAD(P)H-dependent oxidoreductase n=1 Tax=Cytobacillus spartinae TaxID=3299023 RepID=A0ABW6KCN9_9BACI
MNVLVIYAHPNPNSYNSSLKDAAVEALIKKGAKVTVSDLYAMNFNPVAQLSDVRVPQDLSTVPKDLQLEREKVEWADYIIFQFPMWWTSAPAIIKGWFDRVFAAGFAYGPGVYNHGNLKGKKTMLSITTGGKHLENYGVNRLKGEMDERLFNIHHEILYFTGMTVLEPFIVPSGVSEEKRKEFIELIKERMTHLERVPMIPFPALEDYENGNLTKKEEATVS